MEQSENPFAAGNMGPEQEWIARSQELLEKAQSFTPPRGQQDKGKQPTGSSASGKDAAPKAGPQTKEARLAEKAKRDRIAKALDALRKTDAAATAYEDYQVKSKRAAKLASEAEAVAISAIRASVAADEAKRQARRATEDQKPRLEETATMKRLEATSLQIKARATNEIARAATLEEEAASGLALNKIWAAGYQRAPLSKPPFSATPQGQALSPTVPRTDRVTFETVPWNQHYGAAGDVRNRFVKRHAGIDENLRNETAFTGQYTGRVVAATYDARLGGFVRVEFTAPDGTKWEQVSMHLQKVHVKPNQEVKSLQIIGEGAGAGTIFKERNAGPPHVHSEFRRNGRPIEPNSGMELRFNPEADLKERERDLARAVSGN